MTKQEITYRKLLSERTSIEEVIATYSDKLNIVNGKLQNTVRDNLSIARQLTGKDTGTISINHYGGEVKEIISKKITWDQGALALMADRISAAGDDITRFMSIKYSVPEKQYNDFPAEIKHIFSKARTITPGKAKIVYHYKEEA